MTGTKSDPNLTRGPLPREQALAFLKDVVDIAFPRLVQNGYYLPDTVRSSSHFPRLINRPVCLRCGVTLSEMVLSGFHVPQPTQHITLL